MKMTKAVMAKRIAEHNSTLPTNVLRMDFDSLMKLSKAELTKDYNRKFPLHPIVIAPAFLPSDCACNNANHTATNLDCPLNSSNAQQTASGLQFNPVNVASFRVAVAELMRDYHMMSAAHVPANTGIKHNSIEFQNAVVDSACKILLGAK